jgi:hypothetical protein
MRLVEFSFATTLLRLCSPVIARRAKTEMGKSGCCYRKRLDSLLAMMATRVGSGAFFVWNVASVFLSYRFPTCF